MAPNGEVTQLFAELDKIRRDQDWTFLELSAEIARITGKRRDQDCWRRICLGLTSHPHGRTLDILTEFLEGVRPSPKRGRKVRRAA